MNLRAAAILLALDPSGLSLRPSAGTLIALEDGRYHTDGGELRAESTTRAGAAQLELRYLGPSRTTVALANGEQRRQIGLKLRAHDTCNVVYVMWHIAPDSGVFVSVKRNAGLTTHAECGAGGYINVPAESAGLRQTPPTIQPGETHTLRAELSGSNLLVTADGALAWKGTLPVAAFEFDGPVGVRSDNAAFDFVLHAEATTSTRL